MLRTLRTSLLAILLFTIPHLRAQNPYIRHYTTFDGLPSDIVYDIFQDSRKFIWFATDAGAVRFDGSSFRTFTTRDGLNSMKIFRIKEDSSSRIWIFNWDGTLNFFLENRLYNNANAPFLDSLKPNDAFCDFFEDDDRTIYFYNAGYEIYALDSNEHVRKIEEVATSLTDNLFYHGTKFPSEYDSTTKVSSAGKLISNLFTIRKSSSGQYLLWTQFGCLRLNKLFKDPELYGLAYSSFIRACSDRDDCFYIIANCNTIWGQCKDTVTEVLNLPFWNYYNLNRQHALLADRDGNFWVGTFDDGLYCLHEDTIIPAPPLADGSLRKYSVLKKVKTIQHLDIRKVNGIIQDHEGNIWVSSGEEGVFKISPYLNLHRHYGPDHFLNKGIIEMAPGLWNNLWLSNGRSIFLFMADSIYKLGFRANNTSFDIIYHLKTNKLVAGEKDSWFYTLHDLSTDPLKKEVKYRTSDTAMLYMTALSINAAEDKFSGWFNSSFYLLNPDTLFGESVNGYTLKDFDVGSQIHYLYYDHDDNLIINARKNYILLDDTCVPAPVLSKFDNKIIRQHITLDNNIELFSIEDDSIYLLSEEHFYNLSSFLAFPPGLKIISIAYYKPFLYLASFSNVYKCENPLDVLEDQPIQMKLLDVGFRNIHKILALKDSLFIASDDGLTLIPEASFDPMVTPNPIPYIQSILVNDKEVDFSGMKLVLKGRNSLKFILGGISYSSAPLIYSYILEGAESGWSTGAGSIVAYPSLPFGRYTFKMRISKPDSPMSEPLEVSVILKPRLWQHPVFFVFVFLLVVSVASLFFIRRANDKIKQRETDHQLIVLEQKALQSMMNPHFIFNTLGSIQNYLLQNKSGEAGIFLSQFARLIRLNIASLNSAMINLEEEAGRLRIYLDLEQFRTENKFDYQIEYGDDISEDEIYIPTMIIQPFVENCVWHGISPMDGRGMIRIVFSVHSDKLFKMVIEDNGIGMKKSAAYSTQSSEHLHLSVDMIRKRIEIIGKKMKIETSMQISEAFPGKPDPGTRVTLIVPFTYGPERT